ncbi:NAD(P)-binding protein [Hypoxylon sp. FL0890]|nr:NAD(P)-binding protein [Hypoxylon sp. FL0890]
MSKVLAVFGATGQQGSSTVNYVLNDPELSQKYKIRAITRDVDSEKAKQLKEKVEVVRGDPLNRTSLSTALTGAHTVFIMTVNYFSPDGPDMQYNSGKTIADVAVEKGASYIIFSTLPPIKEISGGKYTSSPFDVKAEIEKYIRGLPIKSSFLSAGSFMENFQSQAILALQPAPDGTWVMARHFSPKSKWPLIDVVGDTGKFVGAILADPDKYEGKTLCAATAIYTLEEIIATISKTAGKTVVFKHISLDDFKKTLPPEIADTATEFFNYVEEFGYYGPDTEKLVAWAAANARGRLHTFEEYLEAHPVRLE